MAAKKKRAGTKTIVKQVYLVECVQCGTWFETTSGKALYCSDSCKQKAYRERQR